MCKSFSNSPLPVLWLSVSMTLAGCQATLPERNPGVAGPPYRLDTEYQVWPQAPELPETLTSLDLSGPIEGTVWRRIQRGLRLARPEHKRVDRYLKWLTRHPEHLYKIGTRAYPYLHHIVFKLEQRDMPMELALLPAIESGFRPSAYSPYRAAGIWQFIPSTGRIFGLKQNWWYDGRRDIVAATDAALDYLQNLVEQFDGDWELALAAYNSGAGTVRRAMRINRERGKATDYWSLKLPRETQAYVPRLLALAQVVAEPQRYGNRLPYIPDRPYFSTVATGGQIGLALAAEMASVPEAELRRLNPGFSRWASAPDGPHRLALPVDKVHLFEQALAGLDEKSRLPWSRYEIRSGDTLGGIAHRHGTTVAAIRKANKLSGTRIRAGRYLLIPGSIAKAPPAPRQLADSGNNTELAGSYTVKSGDSLWSIARRYNVNHRKLAAWNNIAIMDPLHPGQRLVVRKRDDADLTSLHYRVQKGDSLARIAKRFNVTIADLRRWNHLPGKYLQPGQSIQLQLNLADQSS